MYAIRSYYALQRIEEFPNRAFRPLLRAPVHLAPGNALVAARIRFDHARIDGKPFTTHQTNLHAGRHHALEDKAHDIALPEPAMAVDRER